MVQMVLSLTKQQEIRDSWFFTLFTDRKQDDRGSTTCSKVGFKPTASVHGAQYHILLHSVDSISQMSNFNMNYLLGLYFSVHVERRIYKLNLKEKKSLLKCTFFKNRTLLLMISWCRSVAFFRPPRQLRDVVQTPRTGATTVCNTLKTQPLS